MLYSSMCFSTASLSPSGAPVAPCKVSRPKPSACSGSCSSGMGQSSRKDNSLMRNTLSFWMSRLLKRTGVFPWKPKLRHAPRNSLNVSWPELSLSSALNAARTFPNSSSAHALKCIKESCVSGHNSLSETKPLRSVSNASHAPAMSMLHFKCLAASRNSCQLTQFELSLSKQTRHALSMCLYRFSKNCLKVSAAALFGIAVSHSGGFQISRKARSSAIKYFRSCQSSMPATDFAFLMKPLDSHELANCE
mmetsp:Transcript_109979/g.317970  ORF Transcript_109979/g.317970 Transcript_109979/m.317970 type:complete len:249 (+) Transcript_109979:493-1239(+)